MKMLMRHTRVCAARGCKKSLDMTTKTLDPQFIYITNNIINMTEHVKRNRFLKPSDDVFSHNAWDDIEWTEEMYQEAEKKLIEQKNLSVLTSEGLNEIEEKAKDKWEDFYRVHNDRFFKDRQWIFTEFPEILEKLDCDRLDCKLLEVGCGVGNAVAHILKSNENADLHIYCFDISEQAINILQQRDLYKSNCDRITAFRADLTSDFDNIICQKIQESSLDFILAIFTLSALKPASMRESIARLATLLKPNGMLLFRDYARYDMAQLRFRPKSYLGENYYKRNDGTTSYFFTKEVVEELFSSAGLERVQLVEDKRMLVNRAKSLKMCRCWIQAKYKKPAV